MGNKLTMESRISEIYANPVGKDILNKLLIQLGKSERVIANPIVSHLKLKTVAKHTQEIVDDDFYPCFLQLLNEAEPAVEHTGEVPISEWWKEQVVYQIYPRSFKDSNGDGIGDLGGIIEKLDYLQELGVNVLWLSPVYDSPNDDNGYDVRDYYQIMREFGTMADFDQLLKAVHQRGMKLIMDLVLNHTSDEHQWFRKAVSEIDSPYQEYYLFKEGREGNLPPNNWTSYFGGPAWNKYEIGAEGHKKEVWALHLFSKKQMDLNWESKKLRQEVYDIINWWLTKGIDGFRLDVINYISKEDSLPDGNEAIANLMGYAGVEHYFYGPHLHDYLREMRRETFSKYNVFTVGETPGVGMEMSKQLTAQERKELDMVFSFDQLENAGNTRFDIYQYDLNYLKQYMIKWMRGYGNNCWMALFYENHDNPRMISKVNPDPKYRVVLGKLLAMIQLTLKGTPFIFQGQELGLMNVAFKQISEFKDIESLNLYQEFKGKMTEDEAFKKILSGSRDQGRIPMPWDSSKHCGFTTGTPWLKGNEDYKTYHAKAQQRDKESVYQFYKTLIALRKQAKALVYGNIKIVDEILPNLFTYYRQLNGETYYIECNLSERTIKRRRRISGYERILSNYEETDGVLRPYEANLYHY